MQVVKIEKHGDASFIDGVCEFCGKPRRIYVSQYNLPEKEGGYTIHRCENCWKQTPWEKVYGKSKSSSKKKRSSKPKPEYTVFYTHGESSEAERLVILLNNGWKIVCSNTLYKGEKGCIEYILKRKGDQ